MYNVIADREIVSLKGRKSILEETLEHSNNPIEKAKIKAELSRINHKLEKNKFVVH